MKIQLSYNGIVNLSAVASFQHTLIGVVSPGTLLPKYWNSFFDIYKNAYIHAVHIKIELTNTGGRPISMVLAEGNSVDSVAADFNELAKTARAVTKTSMPSGNKSVVSLSHTARGSQLIGHRLEDSPEYWTRSGVSPTAAILPVMAFGYQPTLPGSSIDLSYMISIKYDIAYFAVNPQ
jgi:hypothetical protein